MCMCMCVCVCTDIRIYGVFIALPKIYIIIHPFIYAGSNTLRSIPTVISSTAAVRICVFFRSVSIGGIRTAPRFSRAPPRAQG